MINVTFDVMQYMYVKYNLLSHAFEYVTRSCTLMSCLMATTPPKIVCRPQPSSV